MSDNADRNWLIAAVITLSEAHMAVGGEPFVDGPFLQAEQEAYDILAIPR